MQAYTVLYIMIMFLLIQNFLLAIIVEVRISLLRAALFALLLSVRIGEDGKLKGVCSGVHEGSRAQREDEDASGRAHAMTMKMKMTTAKMMPTPLSVLLIPVLSGSRSIRWWQRDGLTHPCLCTGDHNGRVQLHQRLRQRMGSRYMLPPSGIASCGV
eukprot:3905861-Rhodomonas_salina.2